METTTNIVKKISYNNVGMANSLSINVGIDCNTEDIITSKVKVYVTNIQPQNKSAKINARIIYMITYLKDGIYDVYETSSEYACDLNSDKITPVTAVDIEASMENIKLKKVGDGIEISGNLNLMGHFYSSEDLEIIQDIKDCICKTQKISAATDIIEKAIDGELVGEKDFNLAIDKILSSSEDVRIFKSICQDEIVSVEGEIVSQFLFLDDSGQIKKDSFTMPFSYELECENCQIDDKSHTFARITGANYLVEKDENSGLTHISSKYNLTYLVNLIKINSIDAVIDGFSTTKYINFEKSETNLLENFDYKTEKYHCFNQGFCDLKDKNILFSANCRVVALNFQKTGEELNVSGEIDCDVVVEKDGGISTENCILPFDCQFLINGAVDDVKVILTNPMLKQQGENCFVECDLTFTISYCENNTSDLCVSLNEGEERPVKDDAISIIFVEKGEDMWQVCKKAGVSESQLLNQNPNLTFPMDKDDSIIIYHQL